MALQRLSSTWSIKNSRSNNRSTTKPSDAADKTKLALVQGRTDIPLWVKTLGDVVDEQAKRYGSKTAVVFPWQCHTLTYCQLAERSRIVARGMLKMGLQHGDTVGIFAGNCYQYLEVFLGGARIGCPVVVLNTTYTPAELKIALVQSSCRVLFIAPKIGTRDCSDHVVSVADSDWASASTCRIVQLGDFAWPNKGIALQTYTDFVSNNHAGSVIESTLMLAEAKVQPTDVLNLQFTSGTTGAPKAAMLTHINLVNNGRFVGAAMRLTVDDVVCCPPPLFHCFGLVMGFLASFVHGSSIVFPSSQFDPELALDAVVNQRATALLGVPTMFIAILKANERKRYVIDTLRTGVAAGSAVPAALMDELNERMGVKAMLIAYGMTETSPVTFITSLDDPQEIRASSLGQVMPHTGAKIISNDGKEKLLKRGEAGELCTSGYALQKGYWRNAEMTKEVMKVDEEGTVWMHTGDECKIQEDGFCVITGRIKDIIIRGGENIFPIEIEERLIAHPAISEASVVGLKDDRYGEVVACFLRSSGHSIRPDAEALRLWVREKLARHKAPKHVFWIGDLGVGDDFPKTGSGKHQKHFLRDIGNVLVQNSSPKAKL